MRQLERTQNSCLAPERYAVIGHGLVAGATARARITLDAHFIQQLYAPRPLACCARGRQMRSLSTNVQPAHVEQPGAPLRDTLRHSPSELLWLIAFAASSTLSVKRHPSLNLNSGTFAMPSQHQVARVPAVDRAGG